MSNMTLCRVLAFDALLLGVNPVINFRMETWAMAASTSTSIRFPSAPPTVDVREKRIANFLLRDSTLG